jgi:DNA polymerase III alpha subunit (gram-positive type)
MFRNYYTKNECLKDFAPGSEIILFDTETNGRPGCEDQGDLPEKDLRIIELACLKLVVDNNNMPQIVDSLHIYMKPHIPVSKDIEDLTGITNEFLSHCANETDYKDIIFEFFGTNPNVAAYNADFDVWFIKHLYERLGLPKFEPTNVIDILMMSKTLLSGTVGSYNDNGYFRYNLKLGTCVHHFGLDKDIQFHSAIEDTKATLMLTQKYIMMYKMLPDNFFTQTKPKLVVQDVNYWEKEYPDGKTFKRIYVRFIGNGKVFFDLRRNEWVCERFRFCDYDMQNFEKQVFDMINVKDYNGLVEWAQNLSKIK